MQKAAACLILFFTFALVFPHTVQSATNSRTDGRITVLSTDHKFSPVENSLSKVRRDIISSYKPEQENYTPVLLNRSPGTKKKPAFSFAYSDTSFRKKLSARSAIIIDAKTGREIYSHNPDVPRQPASTIKVLTGLIAIDYLKNNSLVPVSNWAASMPRSKIYIKEGRSYYANDLINAVLLASANDASVALAEKIAGSESGFAKMMTRKANELGARSTICKTASGLTAKGQQTTARDLAVIFEKAMQHQEFKNRIMATKVRTYYGRTLRSHNKAMWQISGSLGGKTGYTWAAKQTYVGKFSRNDQEIIVAILGSRNMWRDISRLVDYGFKKTQWLQLAAANENKSASQKKSTSAPADLIVLNDNKKQTNL
ncbi:MAG: D-alanyl-D-alanine carboxypeptidase [Deltaproteobacteria bacterium]|jgi:D-alanyl-D-alanine carboxypeptidase|nr:D-alanyl-D-alanine carboxypeptidase [Deltaproteobacteria bacterium]